MDPQQVKNSRLSPEEVFKEVRDLRNKVRRSYEEQGLVRSEKAETKESK